MRKINNGQKFHNNNNNNTIYSLNYKFDSVCSAGKFSGTALDLIKKYNELAKEAHSNGNYVEMEVFRQYAEHYRKIVTEINERKNQTRENRASNNAENKENQQADENQQPVENNLVETQAADPAEKPADTSPATDDIGQTKPKAHRRRSFTVVEVAATTEQLPDADTTATAKPRRGRRPLNKAPETPAENASTEA